MIINRVEERLSFISTGYCWGKAWVKYNSILWVNMKLSKHMRRQTAFPQGCPQFRSLGSAFPPWYSPFVVHQYLPHPHRQTSLYPHHWSSMSKTPKILIHELHFTIRGHHCTQLTQLLYSWIPKIKQQSTGHRENKKQVRCVTFWKMLEETPQGR